MQLQTGLCVALSDVHLPSDAPGPTMIRKGKTAEQVIAKTPGPLPVMVSVSPQVATAGDVVTACHQAAPGGAAAKYVLCYLLAGGHDPVASASFTVTT